jgi:hypothetical protein
MPQYGHNWIFADTIAYYESPGHFDPAYLFFLALTFAQRALCAAAVQWAERIMRKIDNVFGTK